MKISSLLDKIFVDSNNCLICGRELKHLNRYAICPWCMSALTFIDEKRSCLKCGKPIGDESSYCLICQNNERYFNRAFAPLVYVGETVALITRLKFGNQRYLAKYLSAFLADTYISNNIDADLIIPIPLHKIRLKERGYNQSELLANNLAERVNVPVNATALVRQKETHAQVGLSSAQRKHNIENAFAVTDKNAVKGKKIVVVDDVLTTGATVSEAAKVLHKAGAAAVFAVVLANVPYRVAKD